MTAAEPGRPGFPSEAAQLAAWLLGLKCLLLLIDPHLRIFLGDSASYLHAAATGWVPPDRSFTYPWLVSVTAVATRSAFSLVLLQSLFGVATCLLLFWMLRRMAGLGRWAASLPCLLLAIEPSQLFYERMLMAEAAGGLALMSCIAGVLAYVHSGRLRWVPLFAFAGIAAVSMRLSLLPVVLGLSVLAPLLRAWLHAGIEDRGRPLVAVLRLALHLGAVLLVTLALHSGFKQLHALASGGSADYMRAQGQMRLGLVAPLVQPEHLERVGLPASLLDSLEVPLHDHRAREAHIWMRGGLWEAIRTHAGNDPEAQVLARKIAVRALQSDPLGLVRMGSATFGDYFDRGVAQPRMADDLGVKPPPPALVEAIRSQLGHDIESIHSRRTPIAAAFENSSGWLTLVLFMLAPLSLLLLALQARSGRRVRSATALVLGFAGLGLVASQFLFSHIVSFRYLHPLVPVALGVATLLVAPAAWRRWLGMAEAFGKGVRQRFWTPRLRRTTALGALLALGGTLAWVLAWYFGVAFTAWPDFDGALNFNVSASVAEGRGYGSFYERWAFFPIETQTNGPLVLPTALAMAALGPQPIAFQLFNLLYVLALAGLVSLILRRSGAGWVLALAAALAVLQTPGMSEFALFGYGEVAALCWALASVWVLAGQLQKPRFWSVAAAGTLLGISFLTKTVSLIWFPSVAGLFLLSVLWQHGWRLALRMAVAGAVGVLLALLLWEIYRLGTLGGPEAYRHWWSEQLLEIRKQAGVKEGYSDTWHWLEKLAVHGSALAGYLSISGFALIAASLAAASAVAVALRTGVRQIVALYLLAVCASVAVLYLYWWLLITPTEMMWLRRIMLGLIFVQLALALSAGLLWRAGGARKRTLAALAVALLAWTAWAGQLVQNRPDRESTARNEAELADAVRALPADALTFGSGWWQAPVIALLSGRQMHNEEAWDPQQLADTGLPAFLVLDHYAVNIGADLHRRLAWRCDCEPVFVGSGGRIFRIHALHAHPQEREPRLLRYSADAGIFGPGFSAGDEGGFRWAQDQAVLQVTGLPTARAWVLDLTVPPRDALGLARDERLRLEIAFEGCPAEVHQLAPGAHSLLLQPSCSKDSMELKITSSRRILPERLGGDSRRLAWIFRGLELHRPREP